VVFAGGLVALVAGVVTAGHHTHATYKIRSKNPGVTEIPGRGHLLVIDSGWQGVADPALSFVQRFL